jgi:hypothetical protein
MSFASGSSVGQRRTAFPERLAYDNAIAPALGKLGSLGKMMGRLPVLPRCLAIVLLD